MIKEIIIVEGRNDVSAVKRAVKAEMIVTGGFRISKEIIERIKIAAQKKGVIIFTDPDYAGEKIRKIIASQVPQCKHAFLPKDQAIKEGDIGIENATPENIIEALKKVRVQSVESREEFEQKDLIENELLGQEDASYKRDKLGKELGIGYGNAKQFLNRLNFYGVTREEFIQALEKIR